MAGELLSLREIGRRLCIPPSSVSYYKDRFARFIPTEGGRGRRRKYPTEALNIFREIREMFGRSWSAEQVERELAEKFGVLRAETAGAGESPAGTGHPGRRAVQDHDAPRHGTAYVHELAGVLEKMGGLLEAQNLFRAEVEELRREVTQLREERTSLEHRHQEEVRRLEAELEQLKFERAEWFSALMAEVRDSRKRPDRPHAKFLRLPLVIRSEQGEYLGVSGKGKAFTLNDFILLIERNVANRSMSFNWKLLGAKWMLSVTWNSPRSGRMQAHEFEFARTVTPSDNNVVELVGMSMDGTPAPDRFLMVLFRKIRADFSA